VQIDASHVSVFGNISVFPVVLVILTLMRPFRYRKGAVVTIAYLPLAGATTADTRAARLGASTLLQRALRIGVVQPLQRLWSSGFVVDGIAGFPGAMRIVLCPFTVINDHVGGTGVSNLYRNACIECYAKPADADYLSTNPAAHPRRTLARSSAARTAAAVAPSLADAEAFLAPLSLLSCEPCAFDDWCGPGGPWAGDLFGIAAWSSLCLLHHHDLGYCKWFAACVQAVFSTCALFSSQLAWREAQAVLARFMECQKCFDTGVGHRLVSLGNWSGISWWSGEARRTDAVMLVAALCAVKWPFKDATVQRRLVVIGVDTLIMISLAAWPQWPAGHRAALQASVLRVHEAFRAAVDVTGVSIDGTNKGHNCVVHMVNGATRTGVPSESNLGPGVESVHPENKDKFRLSNGKGEVQDVLAKSQTLSAFAETELAQSFERARAASTSGQAARAAGGSAASSVAASAAATAAAEEEDGARDDASEGEGSEGESPADGTCAYATGALAPGMALGEFAATLPGLRALLDHAFLRYCAEHHGDAAVESVLHSSRTFDPVRCYMRRALKLRRDGVCNRRLEIGPLSAHRPCIQAFRAAAGGGVECDPTCFYDVLLVLSYDVRPQRHARMSERSLRNSDAEEMVLVRKLRLMVTNPAFVRCHWLGPPIAAARAAAAFRHFELVPLSALARPRAVFAAAAGGVETLSVGDMTPWSSSAVNVYVLM